MNLYGPFSVKDFRSGAIASPRGDSAHHAEAGTTRRSEGELAMRREHRATNLYSVDPRADRKP